MDLVFSSCSVYNGDFFSTIVLVLCFCFGIESTFHITQRDFSLRWQSRQRTDVEGYMWYMGLLYLICRFVLLTFVIEVGIPAKIKMVAMSICNDLDNLEPSSKTWVRRTCCSVMFPRFKGN